MRKVRFEWTLERDEPRTGQEQRITGELTADYEPPNQLCCFGKVTGVKFLTPGGAFHLSPSELREAEDYLLREAQIEDECVYYEDFTIHNLEDEYWDHIYEYDCEAEREAQTEDDEQ